MSLTRLSFADADDVLALITAGAPSMLRKAGGTESEVNTWLTSHATLPIIQDLLADSSTILLGIRNSHDKLLAVAGFTMRESIADIHSMYVGVQSMGMGGRILHELLLTAIKDGAQGLSMVVSASNKPMQHLAAKYGFSIINEHPSRSIPLSDFLFLTARPHHVIALL